MVEAEFVKSRFANTEENAKLRNKNHVTNNIIIKYYGVQTKQINQWRLEGVDIGHVVVTLSYIVYHHFVLAVCFICIYS